jgi:hypothetical protein
MHKSEDKEGDQDGCEGDDVEAGEEAGLGVEVHLVFSYHKYTFDELRCQVDSEKGCTTHETQLCVITRNDVLLSESALFR